MPCLGNAADSSGCPSTSLAETPQENPLGEGLVGGEAGTWVTGPSWALWEVGASY